MANEDLGGLTRRHLLKSLATVGTGMAVGLNPFSTLEAKANSLFVDLNDDNYKKEILDYEGPSLVLFYDGNFKRSPPSGRMIKVFETLAKEYSVNTLDRFAGKPIKFGAYDVAPIENLPIPKEKKFEKTAQYNVLAFPTTKIYINGNEIDSLRGGPTDEKWIGEWVNFLGQEWIGTNITRPNGQFYWRFNNTGQEQKVVYFGQLR